MKLIFSLLGVIFLCLFGGISGVYIRAIHKECKIGNCVPLEKCPSVIELRAKIRASRGFNRELISTLANLHCEYKPEQKLSYFCCTDEEIEQNKLEHSEFSKHPNRKLFSTKGDCGYSIDNVNSLNSPLNKASLYEYPWAALIKYRGRIFSSGTIINNRYVLTAARYPEHFRKGLKNMEVILGEYDMDSKLDCVKYRNGKSDCTSTVVVGVEEIRVHPGFSKRYVTNDIALIRLNKPIEFSSNINQICLPFENEVYLHDIPYDVYGHGISFFGGNQSAVTLKNELEVVGTHECAALYRGKNIKRKIDDSVVCVKPKVMPNVCVPDDGGDLSHTLGISRFQLGVASFDSGKCNLKLPFVYTKLTPHLKWILDTVRK